MASSMTKEELKTAIINHGLSPPPSSAKKEEFIEMYNSQVAPVADEAGEFSSDDEVSISPMKKASRSSRASAKSPRVSQANNSSRDSTLEVTDNGTPVTQDEEAPAAVEAGADVDVESLDDDQLFQHLKANGVDVGPIVDSTRILYKKKLAAILRGETGPMNGSVNGGEFSDTEPEDEVPEQQEEEEAESVVTISPRVSTRSKASSSSQKSTRSSARISQKSPAATSPLVTSSIASSDTGLRKRLTLGEDTESSLLRSTPTPRRSIHSYKVTETTKQTIVLDQTGKRTDMTHTVERVESKDAVDGGGSKSSALKKGLLALLVIAVLAALVYYFVQGPGTESVQSIVDSVRKLEATAVPAVEETAEAAPAEAPVEAAPPVEEPAAAPEAVAEPEAAPEVA